MKLQKHDSRSDTVFPKTNGKASEINKQAQIILDNILNHPDKKISIWEHASFGNVIDIEIPSQGGARFYLNYDFIGFLEPS